MPSYDSTRSACLFYVLCFMPEFLQFVRISNSSLLATHSRLTAFRELHSSVQKVPRVLRRQDCALMSVAVPGCHYCRCRHCRDPTDMSPLWILKYPVLIFLFFFLCTPILFLLAPSSVQPHLAGGHRPLRLLFLLLPFYFYFFLNNLSQPQASKTVQPCEEVIVVHNEEYINITHS